MNFSKIDENGNNLLEKSEVRGNLLENFDSLDANNSGTLSADELPSVKDTQCGRNKN